MYDVRAGGCMDSSNCMFFYQDDRSVNILLQPNFKHDKKRNGYKCIAVQPV